MKAIRFSATLPRYLVGLALGKLNQDILWAGRSCTYVASTAPPKLPGGDWVRVSTRYGGICGSDLSIIYLSLGPYFAPFASSPFTIGHENVGFINEIGPEVNGWHLGDRVVVEPLLWCLPRGFGDAMCPYCARGEVNRCERIHLGTIAPGPQTGNCRDTGGSWSPSFVAHQSQLNRVPESVSDENALMVEPFAIGLHAALQRVPRDNERVLIMGAGTVGLNVLTALRALGAAAEIVVMARYSFQADAARKCGADEVILIPRGTNPKAEIARVTGAQLLETRLGNWFVRLWRLKEYALAGRLPRPLLESRTLLGQFDLTFECAGTHAALDEGLSLTRPGGTLILAGEPGITRGVNWTTTWAKEIKIRPAYFYHHQEPFEGKTWKAFDLAIELMARQAVDLSWMVTHRFSLDDYATALRLHGDRRQHPIIKGVFDFRTGDPSSLA